MLQLRSRDEYDDRWANKQKHPDQPGHTAHDLDDIADFFGHLPQADAPRRSEAAESSLSFAQGSDAAAEKAGTAQPSPNPILEAEAPKGPPNTDTDTQGLPHGHSIEGEGVASDPLEKLAPHHHGHDADHTECPGGPYIGGADTGTCFHAGAEIRVGFGKEERQDIEDSFGDNVLMKEWKYFKEGCHKPAQCEFIDPDVNHHQFPVGKSVIRVEGIDIAGNVNHCHRTVYVVDEESPKFVVPSKEVDPSIEIDFPENTCSVTADKPFLEYEEVNGFIDEATDNCDKTVTIVKKLKNAQGDIVYDSSKEGDLPELKGPNQTYTLIYEAIDDYSAGLFAADAPEAVKKAVSRKRIHEASLTLNDVQPPYDFEGCPSDFFVEIEAHETKHTGVFWSPPTSLVTTARSSGGFRMRKSRRSRCQCIPACLSKLARIRYSTLSKMRPETTSKTRSARSPSLWNRRRTLLRSRARPTSLCPRCSMRTLASRSGTSQWRCRVGRSSTPATSPTLKALRRTCRFHSERQLSRSRPLVKSRESASMRTKCSMNAPSR
jgi:hypothetical protein